MSLLEWEILKVTADSILAVDTLLGDGEVLDMEKIPLANGCDEGTGELLLTFRGEVEGEIDGDQVGLVRGSNFQGRISWGRKAVAGFGLLCIPIGSKS